MLSGAAQFAIVASLALAGIGAALLLRRAWRDRRNRNDLRSGGWAVLLSACVIGAMVVGPMLALAFAAAAIPLGTLAVVASGATRRVARGPRAAQLAPEPLEGVSRAWRGWLKVLLAGPLGMLAAMAVAFCYAVWAPGAVQTRLLVAALMVPALWGLGMTWTLADQRLLRSLAVLSGTIVAGFGLAFAGGLV